jgi:hypothetical protein
MDRLQPCYLVLLSASGFFGGTAKGLVVNEAPAQGTSWKANLFDTIPPGKSGLKGQAVKLTPMTGAIHCEFDKGNDFDIPFSGVSEVAYDVKTRNRGAIILQYFVTHLDAYTCSHDCTVALMLVPVFAPFTRRSHYVSVAWREDSGMRRAVFRLSKRDYRAFLKSVSAASGLPFRDIAAEEKQNRRELRNQLKKSIDVRLEHDVTLGGVVLKRRVYKMLINERPPEDSGVSFFAGDRKILTTPTEIVAAGPMSSAKVNYAILPAGDWTITRIWISGRVLRFPLQDLTPPASLSGELRPDNEH